MLRKHNKLIKQLTNEHFGEHRRAEEQLLNIVSIHKSKAKFVASAKIILISCSEFKHEYIYYMNF